MATFVATRFGLPIQLPRGCRSICYCKRFVVQRPRPQSTVICYSNKNDSDKKSVVSIENTEVLIGDLLSLFCFCCYKQISAIVTHPNFPGWLAPLKLNPLRFEEFISLVLTVSGTWVASGLLFSAYETKNVATVRSALAVTSRVWLVSMSIAAAQLVLVTSAEDRTLVMAEGWGSILPLAAQGPGEPFVTGAQILGLMSIWRAFYATYLDNSKFLSINGARRLDQEVEAQHFRDALKASVALAVTSSVLLHFLSLIDQ